MEKGKRKKKKEKREKEKRKKKKEKEKRGKKRGGEREKGKKSFMSITEIQSLFCATKRKDMGRVFTTIVV